MKQFYKGLLHLIKLGKKYLPDLMEKGSRFLDWAGGKVDDIWRWIKKKLGKARAENGSGFSKYQKASLWERLTSVCLAQT